MVLYKIIEKRGPVNYLLETSDRRRKILLCHINLLRPYIERDNIFDNSAGLQISSLKMIGLNQHCLKSHREMIHAL